MRRGERRAVFASLWYGWDGEAESLAEKAGLFPMLDASKQSGGWCWVAPTPNRGKEQRTRAEGSQCPHSNDQPSSRIDGGVMRAGPGGDFGVCGLRPCLLWGEGWVSVRWVREGGREQRGNEGEGARKRGAIAQKRTERNPFGGLCVNGQHSSYAGPHAVRHIVLRMSSDLSRREPGSHGPCARAAARKAHIPNVRLLGDGLVCVCVGPTLASHRPLPTCFSARMAPTTGSRRAPSSQTAAADVSEQSQSTRRWIVRSRLVSPTPKKTSKFPRGVPPSIRTPSRRAQPSRTLALALQLHAVNVCNVCRVRFR